MKRFALCAIFIFATTNLFAQANRTFVATSGLDTGTTCPNTSPCRNISYALAQTNPGGDIVVLDSGGYGPSVNINKAVNIIVPDGIYATLTPPASTTGITIGAGAGDIIRIDGLNVLGAGTANGMGVSVGSCKRTELTNMRIANVQYGVKTVADVKLTIDHLRITNTNTGIWSIGANTAIASSTLKVWVMNTMINGAVVGVRVDSGAFTMPTGSPGSDTNKIVFCTQDAYLIAANVAFCGGVNASQYFNTYTGIYVGACSCTKQDLRDNNTMPGSGNCASAN